VVDDGKEDRRISRTKEGIGKGGGEKVGLEGKKGKGSSARRGKKNGANADEDWKLLTVKMARAVTEAKKKKGTLNFAKNRGGYIGEKRKWVVARRNKDESVRGPLETPGKKPIVCATRTEKRKPVVEGRFVGCHSGRPSQDNESVTGSRGAGVSMQNRLQPVLLEYARKEGSVHPMVKEKMHRTRWGGTLRRSKRKATRTTRQKLRRGIDKPLRNLGTATNPSMQRTF